jgi:hypothetical protein
MQFINLLFDVLILFVTEVHRNNHRTRSRTNKKDISNVIVRGYSANNNSENHESSITFDKQLLSRRIRSIQRHVLEEEISRPPNPSLSPSEFIQRLLRALQFPDEPLPESGYRTLWRSSSPRWQILIQRSIGAPNHATEETIISALGSALSRPQNQYGILVQGSNHNHNDHNTNKNIVEEEDDYDLVFPGEVLDFQDGTCWLETRLRGKKDHRLLVIIGWQLTRKSDDNAWVVDRIDWQDFRDKFRPGIGREEWMRICG